MTNSTPPGLRTHLGRAFTEANRECALSLQHCENCGCVQYPPRELCQQCLQGDLVWRETDTHGLVLNRIALHHSISEFYNQKIESSPWAIASVKLDCGATVIAHLARHTFPNGDIGAVAPDTVVQVFSHADCSQSAVLVAVAEGTAFETEEQRQAIFEQMGLLGPGQVQKPV